MKKNVNKVLVDVVLDNAVIPEVVDGAIELKCADILTEVGRDGRLVLVYRSGLNITISDSTMGLVVPAKEAHKMSLEFAGGVSTLSPGFSGEIVIRFKTNTDSIPAIFEPGDVFARLYLISTYAPLTEVVQSEAKNVVEATEEPKK